MSDLIKRGVVLSIFKTKAMTSCAVTAKLIFVFVFSGFLITRLRYIKVSSSQSSENIHKKEGGPFCTVLNTIFSSVTLN